MLSPYASRAATWLPVTVQNGDVRGSISFEGSLRASYKNKPQMHVKGSFTLERWSRSPTRYRIAYDGFHSATEEDIAGVIALPRSKWNPVTSKGSSNHMVARLLMLTVKPKDTNEGLERIQITIPVLNGGHRAAKTVFEALIAADVELRSPLGENLVGRTPN